jgi:arylsulfatase A-like enzyme
LRVTALLLALIPLAQACAGTVPTNGLAPGAPARPNVVLIMADDQGYGDVRFRGHSQLYTPALDELAVSAVRFERFYAAAPVCSPTRGSCLTGRHPYRYGITNANQGHMLPEELTLAEVLKDEGYRTGHFGKWHLGTLTRTEKDSNRGGRKGAEHYAPPWEHGFDRCFSTEAKVPTFDPMKTPPEWAGGVKKGAEIGSPYGTAYWNESGERVTEGLEGDDSRIIMDHALPFIEGAVDEQQPFLAVIWFHAPHLPVVAGERHLAPYAEISELERRHYYGCITALDEQVGRLRTRLRELNAAEDTMLWYCSDNGPEGNKNAPGSTGGLRGRKRSLFEGGVRVPGFLEWPGRFPGPRTITAPCSTSDYLPTVLDVLGIEDESLTLDGISLLPLLSGERRLRGSHIGFQSKNQASWVGDRFKLYVKGEEQMLFDLVADRAETQNLAEAQPEILADLLEELEDWQRSCK